MTVFHVNAKWIPPVPFTAAMSATLERLDPETRVIGVDNGLRPVLRYPSGRKAVLTSLGRLERT
jgi:hypothetical protein